MKSVHIFIIKNFDLYIYRYCIGMKYNMRNCFLPYKIDRPVNLGNPENLRF